jgi:plastocyanin
MRRVTYRVTILMFFVALGLRAENIEGTVLLKKQLTKRRVTATVPLYQRGQGVALGKDAEDDPVAAERSRVVIWLEGPSGMPAARQSEIVKMEQENRRFVPDTVIVPAGGKVTFPNLDPIFHNVFSLSKPKTFDLGNYPKGDTRTVTFPEPGIVYVNCHLHPNMTAVIVVAPSQWIARSDRDGHFALSGVPPGDYTAVAWHKAAGYFRQPVRIAAGHDEKIEFLIPLDVDGSRLVGTR